MKIKLLILLSAFIIAFTGACDKIDKNDETITDGYGKLVVKITDEPFDISYIESATVTITRVEIRKAGYEEEGEGEEEEGNPFIVISDDTMTFDLIHLRNGITEDLLDIEIPAGRYDLIRLYVDVASLTLKGHPEVFKVKVPSGQQTGIKVYITPALQIEGGLTSEVLLDFDLSRSFVMRGNFEVAKRNGFIFKPVVRASNMSTAGRIEGMVSDTAKVKIVNAKVWIMQDTVMATSFSDTLGYYGFIGVPGGIYSIHATGENYDTVSYAGIKVTPGNRTIQNFVLIEF